MSEQVLESFVFGLHLGTPLGIQKGLVKTAKFLKSLSPPKPGFNIARINIESWKERQTRQSLQWHTVYPYIFNWLTEPIIQHYALSHDYIPIVVLNSFFYKTRQLVGINLQLTCQIHLFVFLAAALCFS